MSKRYVVQWRKVSGKYTKCSTLYTSRQAAILFLNHLIVDMSVPDAHLKLMHVSF